MTNMSSIKPGKKIDLRFLYGDTKRNYNEAESWIPLELPRTKEIICNTYKEGIITPKGQFKIYDVILTKCNRSNKKYHLFLGGKNIKKNIENNILINLRKETYNSNMNNVYNWHYVNGNPQCYCTGMKFKLTSIKIGAQQTDYACKINEEIDIPPEKFNSIISQDGKINL
jgi:hypothetical protein